LTGFEVTELEATGMAEKYLAVVEQATPADTLTGFFQQSETILQAGEANPEAIDPLIAANLFPSSCFGGLAQNIVLMWYFGEWYPAVQAEEAKSLQNARNISPNAYVQGLVWAVVKAHPPGAKQPGYGSWAMPPLSTR
jgi:hypothetical protein